MTQINKLNNEVNLYNDSFNRIVQMYTFLQFICVLIVVYHSKLLPEYVIDIIRASCLSIAILWFIICHFVVGYKKIIKIIYELLPFIPYDLRWYIIPIIDFIAHYLVIYLVGLPYNYTSFIYSSLIVLIWYLTIKHRIEYIYEFKLKEETYSQLTYIIFPIINIICMIFTIYK